MFAQNGPYFGFMASKGTHRSSCPFKIGALRMYAYWKSDFLSTLSPSVRSTWNCHLVIIAARTLLMDLSEALQKTFYRLLFSKDSGKRQQAPILSPNAESFARNECRGEYRFVCMACENA